MIEGGKFDGLQDEFARIADELIKRYVSKINPSAQPTVGHDFGDGRVACVLFGGRLDGCVYWRTNAPYELRLPAPTSPVMVTYQQNEIAYTAAPRIVSYRRTARWVNPATRSKANIYRYELVSS